MIVAGVNPETSDLDGLRKKLAAQIGAPSTALVFDFEIYGGEFRFPKVCLVGIFNHRFDKNLPKLRKIYSERFSAMRFLVPFYDGADADVIPVYESSHQFQGYFIQAYERLKAVECTHYLFVADDLIIRPDLDETNFIARANMHGKKFLSMKFTPLNSPNRFRWVWTAGSSKPFYDGAISWRGSIDTYEEAMQKFAEFFGEPYKENYDEAFFGDPNQPGSTVFGNYNDPKSFINIVKYFVMTNGGSLRIPYPMAGAGVVSDIFCISKDKLFEFSRLCGIFSAMNLFVEVATPTATVLTFKRHEVTFFPPESMLILWSDDRIALEKKYGNDFWRLYNEWDAKNFYIHPVKLSQWTV